MYVVRVRACLEGLISSGEASVHGATLSTIQYHVIKHRLSLHSPRSLQPKRHPTHCCTTGRILRRHVIHAHQQPSLRHQEFPSILSSHVVVTTSTSCWMLLVIYMAFTTVAPPTVRTCVGTCIASAYVRDPYGAAVLISTQQAVHAHACPNARLLLCLLACRKAVLLA
jgi:hypothetical protein